MPLERFYQAKQAEVQALRARAEAGRLPQPLSGPRPDFLAALRPGPTPCATPLRLVAEYKRASPSRGLICATVPVEEAARQYAQAGAHALSVLTEERFFQGSLDFLARAAAPELYPAGALPLLRKDFIFEPLQVLATAATPASALLLIVRLTPDPILLRLLREEAERLGMQAVVEVFDANDLRLARESGAKIIQVNARNLQSLAVDRTACLALIAANPPQGGELWVAASGFCQPEHLRQAAGAGYHAVLVGSALMEGGQPGAALRALLHGARQEEACN